MSSEQLEILCDGLMVYEVDPICEKLAAKGVRFKVVRVTDEEAGIVNPRKDNWASGLSQVCNYFNQGGLTEHLRVLVVAEDLELAKSVIAPAESRPLLHDYYLYASLWAAYQNGTVMAGFSAGAILLSNAGYNDFRLKEGVRYDLIDGMGIVDAYFCPHYQDEVWRGFDKRLEEELAYVDYFEVPETAWAQEDGTMVIFRNDEPEVKVLRPNAHVYQFKRADGRWIKKGVGK